MSSEPEILERLQGRSGELTLRRSGQDLEIILNGCFLVSTANHASSRAMVSTALPFLPGDRLRVLIGGLGLGYALDEALACDRVADVVVAEYEPTIVRWFRQHGGERARRAAAAEVGGRAEVVLADVVNLLASPAAFDLVSLDTDNGPEWLVRDENAALYAREGIALVRRALRRSGAAVFWSPDRYPVFRRRLQDEFPRVLERAVHDVIGHHRHEYIMYVALQSPLVHSDLEAGTPASLPSQSTLSSAVTTEHDRNRASATGRTRG